MFLQIFSYYYTSPICVLYTVLDFYNNVRNQANDLTDQRREQDGDEDDQSHTNDGSKEGQHVSTQGVVVSNHGTEEDQKTHPDHCDGNNQTDDLCFGIYCERFVNRESLAVSFGNDVSGIIIVGRKVIYCYGIRVGII